MALGIRDPNAGPQMMQFGKESDESESQNSSFYGGQQQPPQITDRSSGAKKGLLESEQKLPGIGQSQNENIKLGGGDVEAGNIPVSARQRGSVHPDQKGGVESDPEMNDSRPMGVDNNLDENPVVALAH